MDIECSSIVQEHIDIFVGGVCDCDGRSISRHDYLGGGCIECMDDGPLDHCTRANQVQDEQGNTKEFHRFD